MARKARMEVETGVAHVYGRANDRKALFIDEADRRLYLKRLALVVERCEWQLLSYCLMGNHLHLLVETTREPNLGHGMRLLHGPYAQRFNARHRRGGHVFGGRFGSVRVTSDAQLWATASYIAANPVNAGLCRRPEQWRWSSHAAAVRNDGPSWLGLDRLYTHFSALGGEGRASYARFVDQMVVAV
jgi:REP element-mobilizing transposase RayT